MVLNTLETQNEAYTDSFDLSWSSLGKIEIDFVEMRRQYERIEDLCNMTHSNIKSLIPAIKNLSDLVNGGKSVLGLEGYLNNFDEIKNSTLENMNNQIRQYKKLNEEITLELEKNLNKLVDMLVTNIGTSENSSLLKKYNITKENILNHYTINDETAYNSGENYMTFLEQNLGGSQEKWDILDEMYLYFREKGLNDEQIAGIIGNAVQESGLVLDIKNSSSTATGLFQWLDMQLYNGESNQPSAWDLKTQLDHAWHQIQTKCDMQGVSVLEHLNNNSSSVQGSANTFATFFEGVGSEQYGYRTTYAKAVYTYIKDNL